MVVIKLIIIVTSILLLLQFLYGLSVAADIGTQGLSLVEGSSSLVITATQDVGYATGLPGLGTVAGTLQQRFGTEHITLAKSYVGYVEHGHRRVGVLQEGLLQGTVAFVAALREGLCHIV